ncbi:MAG TPA: ABC transporter permease [Thermoanaerobaculia bacterium]|nr:ABC transporter permease [Thermoanaerobaculia bacterium]
MKTTGAFRERLRSAWTEIRENLGRSVLQALGVMLGVASVLGGFSISDSQRRHSDDAWMKRGGFDKLNVQPAGAIRDGTTPTALQNANLGLRRTDAHDGERVDGKAVQAFSVEKYGRARVRSPHSDRDREIRGIAADYLAMNGYEIEQGRAFSTEDLEKAAPVALLGAEAVSVFFPNGDAVGQVIRVGETPVTVVGVLREKVFRWRESEQNVFAWRNRIIALPATLVAQRMQGDVHQRVDRVVFKIPDLGLMDVFSSGLTSVLKANHRQQEDFRLDDIAARVKKRRSQGQVYNLIFMLSGILSLVGGGMVNVNIQLASLKERVREVGVKMAIGASGREVFKEFMTEALLLTSLGGLVGFLLGALFSKVITKVLEVPLWMNPASFVWAFALALVFGFVFAIYPAWKASRLSPMEALRYE